MGDKSDYRMERIARLLKELEYEVTRGIMEEEIDETIGKRWFIPTSRRIKGGAIRCEFTTRPITHTDLMLSCGPHSGLRLVKGGASENA